MHMYTYLCVYVYVYTYIDIYIYMCIHTEIALSDNKLKVETKGL